MARIKGAMMTRKRRNKVLKAAKGYWGAKSKHFKMAKEQVMKSGNYAFAGRKMKKRDFRSLWITRISAQAKVNGEVVAEKIMTVEGGSWRVVQMDITVDAPGDYTIEVGDTAETIKIAE